MELLESLAPGAEDAVQLGLLYIVLRAIEMRLLSDPELRQLALLWEIYIGDSERIISDRVATLTGKQPSREVVLYLKSCIRGHASRYGTKQTIPDAFIQEVLINSVQRHHARQLRCACCGYHFRTEDIGERRRNLIENEDPEYAKTLHPLRIEDELKPWTTGKRLLTELTVDHLTPEAGLGWTDVDNLSVLCFFCNAGKSIYRRSTEALSTLVAASLQASPSQRAHSMPRQIAVVAAIASAGQCMTCKSSIIDTELTIRLPEETNGVRWLVPWSCDVVCYDCY
jgi:hypothetical protein